MNKGWLELESDPGLFTLLLEDFGVQGTQVEEIYDLTKAVEGPVYGFIFLFKWIEERRARRKTTQEDETFVTDDNIVNSMFFAQQIIPNSCATHALLSVLLNCKGVNLGEMLTNFKEFSQHMGPEDKGFAIGNMPDLARAHNSHARCEPYQLPEKQQGLAAVRTAEAFHFVSYVPINGRLFELDGLKPYPIDHGPWGEQEDWTEQFRRVISDRLGMATNGGEPYHDIRFNLMAVVPDRRMLYEQKLSTLKTNRQIILETLQQMVKVTSSDGDSPGRSRGHSAGGPGVGGGKPGNHAEPIVTRSVAAKNRPDDADGNGLVRSTRLREKAAAAAAMAASSDALNTMVRSPPELDSHNYAKSPDMMELDQQQAANDAADSKASQECIEKFEKQQLQSVKNSDVKIQIAVSDDKEGSVMPTTIATTDITKPLIIQTKFGNLPPGPGTGSSTDTASEVGSCLSSPVCSTGQPSPNVWSPHAIVNAARLQHEYKSQGSGATANSSTGSDMELLATTPMDTADSPPSSGGSTAQPCMTTTSSHVTMSLSTDVKHDDPAAGAVTPGNTSATSLNASTSSSPEGSTSSSGSGHHRHRSKGKFGSHAFTPKDLLQLLKNVESEISTCEANLRDEVDKRNKYKVDTCRRTHNYDQFVCTFLSMLAEQGHLAALVEHNLMGKRRPSGTTPNSQVAALKGGKKNATTDKRKKPRGKKKK